MTVWTNRYSHSLTRSVPIWPVKYPREYNGVVFRRSAFCIGALRFFHGKEKVLLLSRLPYYFGFHKEKAAWDDLKG